MDSPKVIMPNRGKGTAPVWRAFIPSPTTLLLTGYFFLTLFMNGDIKPLTRRGFFCDDSSITYPFKQETINIKVLMFVALILPSLVIKICDIALNRLLDQTPGLNNFQPRSYRKRRKVSDEVREIDVEEEELISVPEPIKRRQLCINEENLDYEAVDSNSENGENNEVDVKDGEVTLFTRVPLDSEAEDNDNHTKQSAYNAIKVLQRAFGESQLFYFGFCTTMLFTGIGKLTLGRLRPHFMHRCVPDINCSEFANIGKYIEEFTCTNKQLRPRDMSYIMTSWPSGHASTIFFSMIYLIIHLNTVIPVIVQLSQQKVKQRFEPLILYATYVLLIGLACYISMTRVSDYHHHASDVLSGSVIGSLTAIVLAKSLSRDNLKKIAAGK